MSVEIYRSLFGTRLYLSDSGACIAVSPDCTRPLPKSISLTDAVSSAGYCVSFLFPENRYAVESKEQAEDLLAQLAHALGDVGRGIIWTGDRGDYILPLREDATGLAGAFQAEITTNLTLLVGSSARISLQADQGTLHIREDIEPFQLSTAGCACAFSNAVIALCGQDAGSVAFTIRVSYDDFIRHFPSGFAYAYPDGVFHFPLLRPYQENPILPLRFQLDFSSKKRSTALFTQAGIRLASRFCTIYGQELSLLTTLAGGFCFPSRTVHNGTLMLSPLGEYTVQTTGKNEIKLLCGLSGTEYLVMQQGKALTFVPEQPAYAARFPEKELSLLDFVNPPALSPLSDRIVTSWLALQGGAYASQPAQAPYYGGSGAILLPAPTLAELPPHGPPVPLVPYGAAEVAQPQAALFEAQAIARARSVALAQRPAHRFSHGGSGHTVASPAGYLVEADGDGGWQRLQLGVSAGGALSFSPPSPPLVSAFCSAELLLAAATPGSLQNNTVTMDGWRFPLCVGADSSYNHYKNILLVKSAPGKLYNPDDPKKSLVSSMSRWTERAVFSLPCGDGAQQSNLANFLTDFFAQAWQQRKNPYFADFAALSTDENWQGFLFLNVSLSPESFPPALRFMIPKDGGSISLHHLGARVTPLKPGKNGPLSDGETSLFGLIYYQAEGFTGDVLPPLVQEGFAYRSNELKVLFRNCAVERFESAAQLTIGDFMEVKPVAGGCPYNTLLLRGAYQQEDGVPSYALRSVGENLLLFSGQPFAQVTLDKVTMCGTDCTSAAFSMGGRIAFVGGEGDVWSFQSLAFSGMKLYCVKDLFFMQYKELVFDVPHSEIRKGSFVQVLSLLPQAIVTGDQDALPQKQGYAPIVSEFIKGTAFTGRWCGLRLRAVLGTTGALAGGGGIGASILLAWDGAGKAYAGIALPGAIMIENVLGLSVGAARLIRENGRLMLLVSDVALKCLGVLKLPPSGALSMSMFEGVGWFAMYKKDE